MNILIKNAKIITCDNYCDYIDDGIIGIEDGIIKFVESSINADKFNDFKTDKIIDAKSNIVMPGLINTHTHGAMTLLRNFAGDRHLEDWLFNHIFKAEARLKEEDVYWGTMLGILEMIKSGTTNFVDMYVFMDIVAKAVVESGIRAVLTNSPVRLASMKEEFDLTVDYYKRWNNSHNERIKVFVEVHSVYLFTKDLLIKAAALAKELNTGMVIHIQETKRELDESQKMYGMSPSEICEQTGIFDVPVIAAHCVHLSQNDVNILKRKNVNVAHNPTSNLKLASGIANVPKMLDAGINISLGTDGAASNNNLNMFEEMHIAALIHKGVSMDPTILNAKQCIAMGTINGAKAIGSQNELGKIKSGMKADLVIVNTKEAHLNPIIDPFSALVYSAQGSDVENVIIDGKIIMENKEVKTIDEEKIIYKANEISKRITKGI